MTQSDRNQDSALTDEATEASNPRSPSTEIPIPPPAEGAEATSPNELDDDLESSAAGGPAL